MSAPRTGSAQKKISSFFSPKSGATKPTGNQSSIKSFFSPGAAAATPKDSSKPSDSEKPCKGKETTEAPLQEEPNAKANPVTPATAAKAKPGTPATAAKAKPGTPATATKVNTVTPATAAKVNPITPVTAAKANPVTPATAAKENPAPQEKADAGKPKSKSKSSKSHGMDLKGRRLKVFWAEDEVWYKGAIDNYDGTKHHVVYDDGEEEWLELAKEKVKLIAEGEGAGKAGKKEKDEKVAASGQARKRRVIMSDDDDEETAAKGGDDEDSDESESEYEAESDAGSDEEVEDLEDEMSDDDKGDDSDLEDEMDDDDDDDNDEDMAEAAAGKKRKRVDKGPRKPSKALATPASTGGGRSKDWMPSSTKATPASMVSAFGSDAGTPVSTTPQAGARRALHSMLDVTPGGTGSKPTKEVVHGVRTVMVGEAERFLARMAQRFPFLHPDRIMDAEKRKPSHPDYDPQTLYMPPNWFTEEKISPGQEQWWRFKAQNFDSVIMFKVGKFYELFEMDAYVGADVLGLIFMKGDQPHSGFPEVRYHDMAEGLARAGYRVVVVEQTETPDQLAERNAELKKRGQKLDKVVTREKVAVLTKGTMIDAEMVQSRPDASYIMAVFEYEGPKGEALEKEPNAVIGLALCIVDVASAQVIIGQFNDDEVRSCLRTHLTAMQPVEVLLPKKELSSTTMRVLRGGLRDPRMNYMRGKSGEWGQDKVLNMLKKGDYFKGDAAAEGDTTHWPALLNQLMQEPGANTGALSAFYGMASFLKESMLDSAVLSLGRVEALPDLQKQATSTLSGSDEPTSLLLNGAALENLEVLENAEGGSAGTLLGVLDHCSTPFGRRRLRQWLCRPLFRVGDITRRQDVVAELMGEASEAAGKARKDMAGISDLERAIARLHASTTGASGRDAAHVILYEDATKRKVKAVKAAIYDLQSLGRAITHLQQVRNSLSSPLLLELTDPSEGGPWFEMLQVINELASATDWKEAESTGRIVPTSKGVDARFDAAMESIKEAEGHLKTYLNDVRARIGGSGKDINYVSVNKETHCIEVPDSKKVPSKFDMVSARKGFKRYMSDDLRELVDGLEAAKEEKETATASILQVLIERFVEYKSLWMSAVDAVSELDALMSLAAHALNSDTAMCRPELVSYPPHAEGVPPPPVVFEAKGLHHPAGVGGRSGQFVPNDIMLGGSDSAPFLVLTGPNMGGKSTMLRQVCLTTLLAQVGACVPAESLRLSPVDAVFVRMGAKDSIMTGQSTFYIELAETAAMLLRATPRSLVALDELGRGTATLDGAAIASAVLHHMAHAIGCRGLFATHYHHLSTDYQEDPSVSIMHMACAVSEGDGGVQEVTFLHKLTKGACPKSYGTNVARLAGLPNSVVARAAEMSEGKELMCKSEAPASTNIDVDVAPPADAAAPCPEGLQELLVEVARGLKQGEVSAEMLEQLKAKVASAECI